MAISVEITNHILWKFPVAQCPVHPSDSRVPLVVQEAAMGHSNIFCPQCGNTFDPVHLIAAAYGWTVVEAVERLNAFLRAPVATVPPFPRLVHGVPQVGAPVPTVDTSKVDYWLSRGLTMASIRAFEAGEVDGLPSLPVKDEHGAVRGVLQRNPAFEPDTHEPTGGKKYNMLGSVRPQLIGLEPARAFNLPYRALVEGPVDAMKCWEAGIPALAISNNALSVNQLSVLAQETREVIIAVDNDEYGDFFEQSRGYRGYLRPFFKLSRVVFPRNQDAGSLSTPTLRRLFDPAIASLAK